MFGSVFSRQHMLKIPEGPTQIHLFLREIFILGLQVKLVQVSFDFEGPNLLLILQLLSDLSFHISLLKIRGFTWILYILIYIINI